jgi:tripartite-type tricarboxylate transporter receptor subunit TctC
MKTTSGGDINMLKKAFLSIAIVGLTLSQAYGAYPEVPISMVVSFAPGGATDITARILAAAMNKGVGQQILVENRPGGNTIL